MTASKNLHNSMYQGLSRASMYFFHTNPSGRILNRFSKDMGQIDEILPTAMIDFLQIFLQICAALIIVAIVDRWLLVPSVLIVISFYYLRRFYLKSAQSIKRMEATSKVISNRRIINSSKNSIFTRSFTNPFTP